MVNRRRQLDNFPRHGIRHMSCSGMFDAPVSVLCSKFSWNMELLFGSTTSSSGPCSPLLLLPFVLALDPQSTSRNLDKMMNTNISHILLYQRSTMNSLFITKGVPLNVELTTTACCRNCKQTSGK